MDFISFFVCPLLDWGRGGRGDEALEILIHLGFESSTLPPSVSMFLVHLFIHLLIKCMDSISFLFLGIWLDATWKLRQKFYIYSSIHSSSAWIDFIWFWVAFWLNASWN